MNIYVSSYLNLFTEQNNIQKFNNLPENININITKNLYHNHKINKIILTPHCINSKDKPPHGLNYIDLPLFKFYIAFEQIISDIFIKKYDIQFDLYNKKFFRFQNFIRLKSKNKIFKFIIQCEKTDYINTLNIKGISIFDSDKLSKFGNFSSNGKYLGMQPLLSNIYLESINLQPILLSEIILD